MSPRILGKRVGNTELVEISVQGAAIHSVQPARSEWRNAVGGANCWTGMAVDEKRGLVFIPTGSAAFDFWGGYRLGLTVRWSGFRARE